jgi:hypothetical protein
VFIDMRIAADSHLAKEVVGEDKVQIELVVVESPVKVG